MLRVIGSAYRGAYSGIRRAVWLLAAASLVNRAGTMVLPFLALYLTTQKGFTAAAAGRALALYGAGGVAGAYLGGWLCSRLSAERVMAGSLLAGGACFLFLGTLDRSAPILAMIFGTSLAFEAFRPANNIALAAASAPGRMAQSLALYRLAINLGMTLGSAIAGVLAQQGYSWLFRVDGATSIAAGALLLGWFRRPAAPAPRARMEREQPGAGERAPGSLLREGRFLVLALLTLLMATIFMQTFGAWTITLKNQYRFAEAQVGAIFAISTLVVVLFEMVLVRALGDRDPLSVVGLGCLLFCAGLALLPLGSSFAFVVATVLVSTLGEMLALPQLGAVFAGWTGEAGRAQALALFSFIFALGFVLAPLAGTAVYEHFGPAVLWYGCGVAGLVLWVGYTGLGVFRRRRPEGKSDGTAAAQVSVASLR